MDGIQETPSLFNLHQGFLKIFDKTKLNKKKWQDWIKNLCDHYSEPNYKLRKIKIKLNSTLKIGWKKSKTVATLALGSRPRQKELQGCEPKGSPGVKSRGSPRVKPRGCPGVKARGSPGVTFTYSRECEKVLESVREWTLTLPRQLSFGRWSPVGLPKLQRAIAGVKPLCLVAFFISLKSSWSLDV